MRLLMQKWLLKKLAKGKIEGKESLRGKPIKRGKCQFLLDLIFPPLEEVSLSNTQKPFFNPLISKQLQNINISEADSTTDCKSIFFKSEKTFHKCIDILCRFML